MDSRGPVFFLQKTGRQGRQSLTCYKLRTMVVNGHADDIPLQKMIQGSRATGRFLRASHLDELPQLLNSIVRLDSLWAETLYIMDNPRGFPPLFPGMVS